MWMENGIFKMMNRMIDVIRGVFSDRTTLSMTSLHGDKEKVEDDIDILFVS